jgi:hypothetical protein
MAVEKADDWGLTPPTGLFGLFSQPWHLLFLPGPGEMANKIDTSSLSLGLGPYGKKSILFSFLEWGLLGASGLIMSMKT